MKNVWFLMQQTNGRNDQNPYDFPLCWLVHRDAEDFIPFFQRITRVDWSLLKSSLEDHHRKSPFNDQFFGEYFFGAFSFLHHWRFANPRQKQKSCFGGGTYFRDIYSSVTEKSYKDAWKDLQLPGISLGTTPPAVTGTTRIIPFRESL